MEWHPLIVPVLAGLLSFVGSLIANRTDIAWLKDRLRANERAVNHVANRLDKHIENHHP